jgi:hypothetical protein
VRACVRASAFHQDAVGHDELAVASAPLFAARPLSADYLLQRSHSPSAREYLVLGVHIAVSTASASARAALEPLPWQLPTSSHVFPACPHPRRRAIAIPVTVFSVGRLRSTATATAVCVARCALCSVLSVLYSLRRLVTTSLCLR